MKAAICIEFINNGGRVSRTFGTSEYYFIYDLDQRIMVDKVTNHIRYSFGSEVFCAQLLIKRGINIVACGFCEDDAKKLFAEAGIRVMENINESPSIFLAKLYHQHKDIKSTPKFALS